MIYDEREAIREEREIGKLGLVIRTEIENESITRKNRQKN